MIEKHQESSLSAEFIQNADSKELMDRIYKNHGAYLMRIITHQLNVSADHSDALDCFNYVLLHLADNECRRVRMFQGRSSFKTYFVSVCRNLIINYFREDQSNTEVDYIEPEKLGMTPHTYRGKNITPETTIIENEKTETLDMMLKEVNDKMNRLSDHERIVIGLKSKKRTYDEINRMTGDKNSAYTLKCAYEKLKNLMGDELRILFFTLIEE